MKLSRGVTHSRLIPVSESEVRASGQLGSAMKCGRCALIFILPRGTKSECPFCEQERLIQELRTELMRQQQQYDLLATDYERARVQVDLVMAMREALSLLSQDDLGFLKQVLYRWKDDRGVTVRVTHAPPVPGPGGHPLKGSSPMPNGLLALYRGNEDDIEQWKFASPGGVALAGYFDEALRINGHPHAMDMLLRAMNQHLPGGLS